MSNIPIFDSLTHPTINGDWILPRYPQISKLNSLLEDMEKNNVSKALAVGMKGVGGYEEDEFANFILSKTDKLVPIAFFDINKFNSLVEINRKLKKLKQLGYKGIKLHPRIGNFNLTNKQLPDVVKLSNDNNLTVMLCTYFYSTVPNSYLNNTNSLIALLEKIPNEKIILLHAGGVKLLEYMEIARAFTQVLLDISLTFLKYKNSSIDADIKFLFESFDRRISIGTDYPEFSHFDLRSRFEKFGAGVDVEKLENIAFKNISQFIL